MSSILRRLFSDNISGCRLLSPRKFCTAAVNRELLEPSSPWLMLPPSYIAGGGGSDMVYNLYSPVKGKVVSFNNRGGKEETELLLSNKTYMLGSSHGWLALYNSRKHDIILCNPLSGRRIPLPPLAGKPFRDKEDMRPFTTKPFRDNDNEEVRLPWKVILSCSPQDEDCRALMVLCSCDRAAFCLPGRSNEWSTLGRWYNDPLSVKTFNDLRFYSDFVYSAAEKNFLGFVLRFTRSVQELEGWDVANPVRPRTVRLDRFGVLKPFEACCLSGSCIVSGVEPDQLFLVRRVLKLNDGTFNVIVYKIKDGDLELCSSLDDLVMFVGINHSVAVRASQFPGLKPNSIYVSETRHSYVGQFVGVYDYHNKTWSPVYNTSLNQKDDASPQVWFTPTLD